MWSSPYLVTFLVSAVFPVCTLRCLRSQSFAGFTISVAIGVFFGVWPAVKASQLDPVDALRYE